MRFHPMVIAAVLVLLAVAGVLIALNTEPVLLWAVAILVPVVGGVLAATGRAADEKTRRFLKAFGIVVGAELAVGVIAVGVCLVILNSQGLI
jgi:hypothetical protein